MGGRGFAATDALFPLTWGVDSINAPVPYCQAKGMSDLGLGKVQSEPRKTGRPGESMGWWQAPARELSGDPDSAIVNSSRRFLLPAPSPDTLTALTSPHPWEGILLPILPERVTTVRGRGFYWFE